MCPTEVFLVTLKPSPFYKMRRLRWGSNSDHVRSQPGWLLGVWVF